MKKVIFLSVFLAGVACGPAEEAPPALDQAPSIATPAPVDSTAADSMMARDTARVP
jgi:hypothetical protein